MAGLAPIPHDPPTARVFRLELEYDGGDFSGWQLQGGARTVQGVVEDALSSLLGEPARVAGAGRTDAGCHARGQVVSVRCRTRLEPASLAAALNARLPRDARVTAASEAAETFHARHSAAARRYSYRLLEHASPYWRRVAWWPRRPLRPDALRAGVQPLMGRHDFASFASAGGSEATGCTVERCDWKPWEAGWMLIITADHFLYRMVRALVGTALELQPEADPGAAMRRILAARDRHAAGPTAPPHGLCLERVYYAGEAREEGP